MSKKFAEVLGGHPATLAPLPLVHTTSVSAFEDEIVPQDRLEAFECKVYNKQKLAYLFYGRPAYRPRDSDVTYRHMIQHAPVCLVLDVPPGLLPERIMPFDSGAYHEGFLQKEGHVNRGLKKERFELSQVDQARSLVGLFFGSNISYYDERPIQPLPLDPSDNTCVESYLSLITRHGNVPGDSRLNTIEFQFASNITLSGAVLAVAMAEQFYHKRPEIQATLSAWGAEPLLYELSATYTPGECCRDIDRLVRRFIKDKLGRM